MSIVWPNFPQWVLKGLSFPLALWLEVAKFCNLVAKAVDSTLTEFPTDLCISSWMNKEYALLIQGSGSIRRIWVLTWEKDSLSPIRNFITVSFAWRFASLWLMPQTHFPHVNKGNGLKFSSWSHNTFNWVK